MNEQRALERDGLRNAAPRSPSGRPMRVDARRNRARIFDATRQILRENPYGASIEAIADLAGVGIATVYRHFPRRLDLLKAVYREDLFELEALSCKVATGDPWESLVTWLRAFVRFTEAKRAINTELGEAFQRDPELAALSRHSVDTALNKLVSRARSSGQLRSDVTVPDLVQLVGGMNLSILFGSERNDEVLDIVLRGIRN